MRKMYSEEQLNRIIAKYMTQHPIEPGLKLYLHHSTFYDDVSTTNFETFILTKSNTPFTEIADLRNNANGILINGKDDGYGDNRIFGIGEDEYDNTAIYYCDVNGSFHVSHDESMIQNFTDTVTEW